jgi:hypothetical protein
MAWLAGKGKLEIRDKAITFTEYVCVFSLDLTGISKIKL